MLSRGETIDLEVFKTVAMLVATLRLLAVVTIEVDQVASEFLRRSVDGPVAIE